MAKDKNPLDAVVRFIANEGWHEDLDIVLREHTDAACAFLNITPASLASELEPQVYAMMFTCVVEDLMSRKGADGRNVTDAFIKRHGWKLGTTVRRQLETLRDSKAGFYEVTAVRPGVGLTLTNLLTDDATVDVQTPGLADALPVGCPIGLRVLAQDKVLALSGGILPFEVGMSDEGVAFIQEAAGGADNLAPHISAFWIRKTIEEQRLEQGIVPHKADAAGPVLEHEA